MINLISSKTLPSSNIPNTNKTAWLFEPKASGSIKLREKAIRAQEILEFFPTKKDAFNAQEKYICLHETHVSQNGYNASWKGGHQIKNSVSKETREKMKISQTGKKQSKEQNEDEEIQEFSTVGGGAIAGYSLPLGANPDNYGRKKNSTKRKKS